jgi:methylated-DNA-[protein]-cysteine S-methyltransferase
MRFAYHTTPIGPLLLVGNDEGLRRIGFPTGHGAVALDPAWQEVAPATFGPVVRQLDGYFAGTSTTFEVPLCLVGTAFQQSVWHALRTIPYGTTVSYRDLAQTLGHPSAVRAVGAANGANPIPIIIPCHRVIGADGSLVGFGGGLQTKRYLLSLEGALPRRPGSLFDDALGVSEREVRRRQ